MIVKRFDVWLGAGLVLLTLLVAYGLHQISHDEGNTRASAHSACLIQARGLKAQRYLVNSLDALHRLATLPPSRAARRQRRAIPPAELRHELRLLYRLNQNTAAYVALVRMQPATRRC